MLPLSLSAQVNNLRAPPNLFPDQVDPQDLHPSPLAVPAFLSPAPQTLPAIMTLFLSKKQPSGIESQDRSHGIDNFKKQCPTGLKPFETDTTPALGASCDTKHAAGTSW